MKTTEQIREWYNGFTKKQKSVGINLRHYKIINKAIDFGLKNHHVVLEVGCGIGTLTTLLNNFLNGGRIVGTDISDASIEIARSNVLGTKNKVEFIVSDMIDFSYSGNFDFIILPDVLEHIPIDQHQNLFEFLSNHMDDHSVLLIHIPHPKGLDFIRKTYPERLQIIDQSIHADSLMESAYSNNLILCYYEAYSLFSDGDEYVFAGFKRNTEVNLIPKSKMKIIIEKIVSKIRFQYRCIFYS